MNNPQLVLIIKRGMEMEIIHQPQLVRGNGVIILATCRNPRCDLYTVTLTPEQLGSLTAEQLEAYHMMVRNMRELKD